MAKGRIETDDKPLTQNPFAALKGTASGAASAKPSTQNNEAPAAEKKGPARAVVRLEKKGRRGKEVTVVEKLGLSPAEREAWLKALKQSLGTGGAIDEIDLVLQGDHRDRLVELLEKRGVKKVTKG